MAFILKLVQGVFPILGQDVAIVAVKALTDLGNPSAYVRNTAMVWYISPRPGIQLWTHITLTCGSLSKRKLAVVGRRHSFGSQKSRDVLVHLLLGERSRQSGMQQQVFLCAENESPQEIRTIMPSDACVVNMRCLLALLALHRS